MTPLLPAPDADQPSSKSASRSRRRKKESPDLPGIDEILARLLNLPGLVAMGIVSTQKAAVIHSVLRTVLQSLQGRVSSREAALSPEDLAELCQKDPRIVHMLEPFLSDEQVDWLMGRGKDYAGDADAKA